MASTADIPALVRQLRGGSRVTQLRAAKAVFALAEAGGEAAAEAVVAAGGVPPLLALLGGGNVAAQQAAARTLFEMAETSTSTRTAILEADGAQALVRLLGSSRAVQPQVLSKCAAVLMALSCSGGPEPCRLILAAGGAPVLVGLLSHASEVAQLGAAAVVSALAGPGNEDAVPALLAAGAVQPLVGSMVRAQSPWLVDQAAGALANLVRQDAHGQAAVQAAEAGALPFLLRLLDGSNGSQPYCAFAAYALCNTAVALAALQQQGQQTFAAVAAECAAAGAVAAATRLLSQQRDFDMQRAGAAVIWLLASSNEASAAELVAAGVVPQLLKLTTLEDGDLAGTSAKEALRHLAAASAEAAAAVEEAGMAASLGLQQPQQTPNEAELGGAIRCGS